MMFIDSHAHIQDRKLIADVPRVISNARAAGVDRIICVGYDYDTSVQAVELSRRHSEVYAVVGVHPHDAKTLSSKVLADLFTLARDPKVVAIGETGLDFFRDLSPRDMQKQAFREQIRLARELYKPVVIHDREAHQEVADIIKQEKAGINGGVLHCYSGHLPLAIDLMKEGFYISFAGPLTYKNAQKTHEVASRIGLDRVLIETDCPYLTPEPLRGKRNEPAYVKQVAAKLAELRKKSIEEIGYITSLNTCQVFRLDP